MNVGLIPLFSSAPPLLTQFAKNLFRGNQLSPAPIQPMLSQEILPISLHQKLGPVCLLGELELGEEVGRAVWDESLSPLFPSEQGVNDGPNRQFQISPPSTTPLSTEAGPLILKHWVPGCYLESVVTARLPLTPPVTARNARPARSVSQIFDV